MLNSFDHLELITNLEETKFMDILKEMQKHLGIIPSDTNVDDNDELETALILSVLDDKWYGLVDIFTDELVSVARGYGSYYKAPGEQNYSPLNSLMVFTPEEHRGFGYAGQLITEITKQTHINGFAVNPANTSSKRLLEKLGYVLVDHCGALLSEAAPMEIYLQGPNHGYANRT